MERVCEGSVAVGWEEGNGDVVCMRRFCSGGMGRGTWRWDVYARVLWRYHLWRHFKWNNFEVVDLDVSERGEIPNH